MKLREFLNTSEIDWIELRIWTSDDVWGMDNPDNSDVQYTDMRDIEDATLDLYVDCWSVRTIIENNTVKYILEVLI